FGGLRVYRSERTLRSTPHGVHSTPPLFEVPPTLRTWPRLSAAEALQAAARFLQQRGAMPQELELRVVDEQRFSGLVEQRRLLSVECGLAEPARLHLEVFPLPKGRARLAWVGRLAFEADVRCEVVVSADSLRPRVLFCTGTGAAAAFKAKWIRYPGDP